MKESRFEFNHYKKFLKFYIAAFYVIFACVSVQTYAAPRVSERRQKLITYALTLRGTKYVFGGQTPEEGFDCSGFVDYAVNHGIGIQLPRKADNIYKKVRHIEPKHREPGDLIFFKNDLKSDRVTHVGIYCGVYHGKDPKLNGKRVFISAVSDGPKTGVILSAIDEKFWKNHFFAYGRILPPSQEDLQKEAN